MEKSTKDRWRQSDPAGLIGARPTVIDRSRLADKAGEISIRALAEIEEGVRLLLAL